MADARHHRAVQVVFVPIEIGSPKQKYQPPPPNYPSNQREAWRPAQDIPRRETKGQAAKRLFDNIVRQDADVRAFMAEARRISAERRLNP